MRLPIEKWIAEHEFPKEVTNLLEEGIVCYKIGAYRAGLLFSYLGLEKILKIRLLKAKRPDNVPESAWENIKREVNNETKWEEKVFSTVTGYSDTPIFIQDRKKREEMSRQLSYWRDRRNDAAHAKENEIQSAHVEAFWLFMQSNLPKLVVRGSRDAILDSIELHFDDKYTPEEADFSHIIQQIKHSLYEEDLISFYEMVMEKFEEIEPFYVVFGNPNKDRFWHQILNLEEPHSHKLVDFLKSEKSNELFYNFIDEYPSCIVYFSDDKSFIYNLWNEKINKFNNPTKLVSVLLRNNLIDEQYVEIALKKLIKNLDDKNPDELDYQTLVDRGYLITFRNYVFGLGEDYPLIDDFNWANKNKSPVRKYLRENGLDGEIVNSLSSIFKNTPYPFKMCENLTDLFQKDEELRKKFIEISSDIGIALPENLGFREE